MKKVKKQILSVALVFAMVLSMMPAMSMKAKADTSDIEIVFDSKLLTTSDAGDGKKSVTKDDVVVTYTGTLGGELTVTKKTGVTVEAPEGKLIAGMELTYNNSYPFAEALPTDADGSAKVNAGTVASYTGETGVAVATLTNPLAGGGSKLSKMVVSLVDDPNYGTKTPHNVNIAEGIKGGSVSVNKASASEGATIVVTTIPESGYEVSSISVVDENNNSVDVDANSFVMPDCAVTVSATFSEKLLPTVIDFPTSEMGIERGSDKAQIADGKISFSSNVTDSSNAYAMLNDNYAKLEVKGGFKAGDVIEFSGYFSNSDKTKDAGITIYDGLKTPLVTNGTFINYKAVNTDKQIPSKIRYTLQSDTDVLYFGRYGGTTVYVTSIKMNTPAITNASLTLGGMISENFYVDIPASAKTGSYMEFTLKGATTRVDFNESLLDSKTGYYKFPCKVNSAQMSEDITATFHYGTDKTISLTHSVSKYTTAAAGSESFSDVEKTLVQRIQNFGHYAQASLAEKNGWAADSYTATSESALALSSEVIPADKEFSYTGTKPANISAVNYALVLDAETTLNLYFTSSDELTISDFTVVGSNSSSATVTKKGDVYCLSIPNIPADKLGEMYTVSIGTLELHLSALSYAKLVLGSSMAQCHKDMAQALYDYYLASVAYKNS